MHKDDQQFAHISEEQWQAITHNDASYDKIFIYAVKSTGIFCRPSCKSRLPNKANVFIFKNAEQALEQGFRSCKRCKPEGLHVPDEVWVIQIVDYIDSHYSEPLTLEVLANMCHGSPYHLQRTFKRIKGITPVEYIRNVRIEYVKEHLKATDKSIGEIGARIGLPNTPYFITLFKKHTGYTPLQYRKERARKSRLEVSDDGRE
ncbi:MAG TPA: bifunctional transcriptional activator/DNA repair enzyme AdaA [Paenisporosarcina sp.]|nr:bifunctional transcriptional activator/DNA repair enzyme AdaA [Paenisporosarcina sp.]